MTDLLNVKNHYRVGSQRLTATLIAAIVALGFTSFLLVAPLASAHAESLGSWASTTGYPVATSSPGCAVSNSYIYCVGGALIEPHAVSPGTIVLVYFASISSSGIGGWTQTTSYPTPIMDPSCVISDGYIYCVGGDATCQCSATNDVYYAPVTSSGVGAWTQTTSYPVSSDFLSCVASASYIYCLVNGTGVVYFAQLSSAGVGPWTSSTSYPINISYPTCTASGGYVYCVGGRTYPPGSITVIDATYYAPLTSAGVGAWASTTSYPTPIDQESCTSYGGYIYCVGGETQTASNVDLVYYAPISSSGIGAWIVGASHPAGLDFGSCLASAGGYIYCISGTPDEYYAFVGGPLGTSQITVNTEGANGQVINGYYVVLYQDGEQDASSFSPATFSVTTGLTFVVQADDYGSCHFDHWQDSGSTAASRTVVATGNVQLYAVYSCGGSSSSVTVDSADQNGIEIFGYYTVLFGSTGNVVDTGFTTKTVQTTAGQTYEVQADNYGGCTFNTWFTPNGIDSANPMTFTAPSGPIDFTALYNCQTPSSTINVSTANSLGNAISGYYTTLWHNGAQIQSCFSPCSFTVTNGQTYQVLADSYGSETFNHWANDGSLGAETVNVPGGTTINLTAVYTS